MNATIKYTAAIVMAGLGLLSTGSSAQAFSYRHVDNLALRLQRQTAEMHREVHAHFRPSYMYKHLDADVSEMEQLARHIHEVAHHRGSIAHLRADVAKLDRLYHHIEELLSRMVRARRVDFHAICHFRRTMRGISQTLHHLQADLRAMDYHDPDHYRRGGHDGHGHGRGGQGVRIGNSRFGIQFRFGH